MACSALGCVRSLERDVAETVRRDQRRGQLLDRFSTCGDEMVSGDGYRLLWFQSTRKAAFEDAATRNRRLQKPRRPCELKSSSGHGHGFASAGKWNRPSRQVLR